MVFSSLTFLLYFMPITLILYFIRSDIRWRNAVLLAASLLFYAWGEPVWIVAMLFSTWINWVCACAMVRSRRKSVRKKWMILGVSASALLLFIFKYSVFFINCLINLFGGEPLAALSLPIGISFYTFQIITYTVDVYRKKAKYQPSYVKLLLYVVCFPQLIAGPIVQYSDVAREINRRESTPDGFATGMQRFVVGLGKKVILANTCGNILQAMPGAGELSVLGAWYGALLYALQIYFDFSGYSDMAIGLGRIFGFRYKENFNYPYAAVSVRDFWRRWHISLGSFFREYVYIPLGGNRKGLGRTIFNTLVVWTLTGLWHGAAWTFILWGAYYGILLTIDLLGGRKLTDALPAFVNRIFTFALVLIGWVIFYYATPGEAFAHIGAMFGAGARGLMDAASLSVIRTYTIFPLIALFASLPIAKAVAGSLGERMSARPAETLRVVLLSLCLIFSIFLIVGSSYNPFIYFRF